ncbi:MAG: hybrid sensor histidine kinase/response regulator [Puniceicoccaceae bacterium]|nr:MAG: hybrid sensor histidine kinase/response regulator [Puniceicoccaceae bacterium]
MRRKMTRGSAYRPRPRRRATSSKPYSPNCTINGIPLCLAANLLHKPQALLSRCHMKINRTGVLFVDDEENALKAFRRAFNDCFEVFTASSAALALETLAREGDAIGVVIADQRMPQRSGISMLSEVRQRYPDKIRLLTTAYTQIDTLVDAINEGAVYSFISKPWDLKKLRAEIFQAIDSYATASERTAMLENRIEELRQAVLDEKVMEIGNVAVNLSHYVDNALCPVDLLISKIETDLTDPTGPLVGVAGREVYLDFLKRIRSHINSTSRQISRLHQANSALDEASLGRVDLVTLCQEAIRANQALMDSKGIRFQVQSPPEAVLLRASKNRLEDFFNFLLAEEVVSLPEDSLVNLRIACLPDQDIVRICLEDCGPVPEGLSASHLLYPFNVRSGDPRQLGIFLVCAYFIVRSHGGSMKTELREAGGVSFSFDFPVAGSAVTPPQTPDQIPS